MILCIQIVNHLTSVFEGLIRLNLFVECLKVLEDVLASFLQHINMFSQSLRWQMLLVVPARVLHLPGNDQLLLSLPLLMLECTKADCLVEILRVIVVQIQELVSPAAIMATALVDSANEESLDQVDS